MKMKSNTTSLKQLHVSPLFSILKYSLFVILFSFSLLNTNAGNKAGLSTGNGESPISEIFISDGGHNLILSWQVDKQPSNIMRWRKVLMGRISLLLAWCWMLLKTAIPVCSRIKSRFQLRLK